MIYSRYGFYYKIMVLMLDRPFRCLDPRMWAVDPVSRVVVSRHMVEIYSGKEEELTVPMVNN